jgi:Aspartyl protease
MFFVVPIEVNGTGPYDFLVDTGAQSNSIDEALASQLHLAPKGTASVSGAGTFRHNPLTQLDLRAGNLVVRGTPTVVVPHSEMQALGPRVQGILGGAFLDHFDILLDNGQSLLCLDDSGYLASRMKGRRIGISIPLQEQTTSVPFAPQIIVSAELSDFKKPLLLALDSGTNVPVLFADSARDQLAATAHKQVLKRFVDGVEQDFTVISPQIVRLEGTQARGVSFAVPTNLVGERKPLLQEDGFLPTTLFRRVFISYSKGYVLLDPWN